MPRHHHGDASFVSMSTAPKLVPAALVTALALALAACSQTELTPAPTPTARQTTTAPAPHKPVDSGASSGASGTVEKDADGTPTGYVVAEGDTAAGIEHRFGVDGLAERYNRYLQPGERLSLTPQVTLP